MSLFKCSFFRTMESSVSELAWSDVLVEAAVEGVESVAQPPEQRKPPAWRNSHGRTAFCPRPLDQASNSQGHKEQENQRKRK